MELASRLTATVNEAFATGEMMEQVSPVTAELLRFWFCEPFTNERGINFHEGQRQAILNAIYLHEVLKISNVMEIYKAVVPELLPMTDLALLGKPKYAFPKYAVKTGIQELIRKYISRTGDPASLPEGASRE